MSHSIIRALLRPAHPTSPSERTVDRYRDGLYGSYFQRATVALRAAEPLLRRSNQPPGIDVARKELLRASELFFKAVRIAMGLSATRARELRALIAGGPGVHVPIPGCAVSERLASILAVSELALTPEIAQRWVTELQSLARECDTLPQFPRAAGTRATPRPRSRATG